MNLPLNFRSGSSKGFRRAIFGILMIGWTPAICMGRDAVSSQVKDARKIVAPFLAIVDAGKYGAAFDQYAETAKARAKSKGHSIDFYRAIRAPHGTVHKRRVVREEYTTNLPLLPKSQYVVFDFRTDFADKKNVKEEVLTECIAGHWEIAGYACQK